MPQSHLANAFSSDGSERYTNGSERALSNFRAGLVSISFYKFIKAKTRRKDLHAMKRLNAAKKLFTLENITIGFSKQVSANADLVFVFTTYM